MRRTRFSLIAIFSAMVLVLAACGGSDDAAADDDEGPSGSVSTTLDVTMTDFAFAPDSLVVAAGQEITLNLENTGGVEHNFVIMSTPIENESEYDEADVHFQQSLQGGESGTFAFTAPAAGTYQVICSISGHFTAGMVGELTSR